MHMCMLYVQRLLASENLRPLSSHPYRFSPDVYYMYIKYHSMKMSLYISHRSLSAMHTDAFYKGELATTNITLT